MLADPLHGQYERTVQRGRTTHIAFLLAPGATVPPDPDHAAKRPQGLAIDFAGGLVALTFTITTNQSN
jgi:hypothetical protein